MAWLADKMHYVWPVILAGVLARREIKRRRQQDVLKAQLKAEALGGHEVREPNPPSGKPTTSGPTRGRHEHQPPAA